MYRDIKIVGEGKSGWTHEIEISNEELEEIKHGSGLLRDKILELVKMEEEKIRE